MSCINIDTLGKTCGKCNSCTNPFSDDNMAYFASQEFTNKILANMSINSLNTNDKTLVGALTEIEKLLDSKQDHSAQLDYLSTLPQKTIEDTIQFLQVLA